MVCSRIPVLGKPFADRIVQILDLDLSMIVHEFLNKLVCELFERKEVLSLHEFSLVSYFAK